MQAAVSNKELLKDAYRQWHETKGASVETWMDLLAPDASFRSIGEGLQGGEFAATQSDRESIRNYFDVLRRTWSMEFWEVHEMIAEGDQVAMLGRCSWTNKATQKTIETPVAAFWRFRDGKAIAYFETYDTHRMVQAATADPIM